MIRACKCFGKVFQSHKGLRFNPLLSDDELYCAGVSVCYPSPFEHVGSPHYYTECCCSFYSISTL